MAQHPIVETKNIWKSFKIRYLGGLKTRKIIALKDVSIKVFSGEVVGIVGESGCGKTTLGRIVLGVEKPDRGEVYWFGKSLKNLTREEYKKLRPKIQAVFQDPYSSLNPRYKIKDILLEPYLINIENNRKNGLKKAEEILNQVGIDSSFLEKYPHELSGGQRQRVALARTLMINPSLIVLDEPTSALDVTVQAQILELLLELKRKFFLSYLIISHSLPVISYLSDWIAVLYLGEIVEIFHRKVFKNVLHHPYTMLLLSSEISLDRPLDFSASYLNGLTDGERSQAQDETVVGCSFYPRCKEKSERCKNEKPSLKMLSYLQYISCFNR